MSTPHPFHAAACRALGIDDGWGSQAQVADHLGVARTQYTGVLTGARSASLDLLARWAADLGIVLVCYPAGRVEYVATPLQHAREAIELVQRIPLLMGADHPTAHHETDHIVHHMGDLVRWLDVPDEEE